MSMRRLRSGFTLVELLVAVAILAMLLAVAIHQLARARVTTNEQLALNSVRVISKAGHAYFIVNGKYPPTLVTLGPTVSIPSYLDATLAKDPATKQGYIFTFTVGGGGASFRLLADPVTYEATGTRHFYVDQGFVIHATLQDKNATSSDPSVP